MGLQAVPRRAKNGGLKRPGKPKKSDNQYYLTAMSAHDSRSSGGGIFGAC